ncbi:pumilio12-like [Abeliophyllum distichum]|uniref:Pumilio12-like n=1 Tax=Abeliophyllum distichum TaxID=126358 RepID=A0ABD1SZS0_9LAMI
MIPLKIKQKRVQNPNESRPPLSKNITKVFVDFQAQQETSSVNLPPRLDGLEDAKPVPFSVGFGEKQENIGELQPALFWARAQGNDGGVNGPFSLEVQLDINEGPEMMGFGKSSYLDGLGVGVDPLRLMEYQGHDVYDTFSNNHDPFQEPIPNGPIFCLQTIISRILVPGPVCVTIST